jgi:hypothetical protein
MNSRVALTLDRSSAAGLFRLDPELLDDWPPFLDFGLLIGGKRLGRLLVAGKNLKREVGKAGAYRRIGQGSHGSGIEFRYDILRGALRCPQAEPSCNVNPGNPASSTVGISGAAAKRLLAATAMRRHPLPDTEIGGVGVS